MGYIFYDVKPYNSKLSLLDKLRLLFVKTKRVSIGITVIWVKQYKGVNYIIKDEVIEYGNYNQNSR